MTATISEFTRINLIERIVFGWLCSPNVNIYGGYPRISRNVI